MQRAPSGVWKSGPMSTSNPRSAKPVAMTLAPIFVDRVSLYGCTKREGGEGKYLCHDHLGPSWQQEDEASCPAGQQTHALSSSHLRWPSCRWRSSHRFPRSCYIEEYMRNTTRQKEWSPVIELETSIYFLQCQANFTHRAPQPSCFNRKVQ